MIVIDFRNDQRDILVHSMILGISQNGISGAGKILFDFAGNGRIKAGKHNFAIEVGRTGLDPLILYRCWNWGVLLPRYGFGVWLTGGPIRGRQRSHLEPRMVL